MSQSPIDHDQHPCRRQDSQLQPAKPNLWANQAPWMPKMQVIFHLFQTLLRNKRMFLVDSSLFWQVQTVKLVVSGSSQNLVKGGAVGHDASHYDSSGTQLVLIDSAELRSRFYIYQYSMRIRVILNWGNADRYKTRAKWPCCSIFGGHFEYASSLWPLDAIVSPSIFAAL